MNEPTSGGLVDRVRRAIQYEAELMEANEARRRRGLPALANQERAFPQAQKSSGIGKPTYYAAQLIIKAADAGDPTAADLVKRMDAGEDPKALEHLLGSNHKTARQAEAQARRERVMEGIRAGLSRTEIAKREGVDPQTISKDIARLREQSVPRDIARAIKRKSTCKGCEVHCPRRRR